MLNLLLSKRDKPHHGSPMSSDDGSEFDAPSKPPKSDPIPTDFADIDRASTDVYDSRPPQSAPPDEPISRTGFIPNENFQRPSRPDKDLATDDTDRPSITIGNFTLSAPTLTWLDSASTKERLLYAGGGLLAGLLIGGVIGVLNTVLQGSQIIDETGLIFALAFFFGIICAPMAAMRPRRVDKLLAKIGISDD